MTRTCPCCEGVGTVEVQDPCSSGLTPDFIAEPCHLCRAGDLDARRGSGRIPAHAVVYRTFGGDWSLITSLTVDTLDELISEGAEWGDDASLFLVLDTLNNETTREAA